MRRPRPKVRLRAFRESGVTEWDHDGEEGFEEDVVEVVYEDYLEGSGAVGEDGSGGVGDFEVFGYGVDVC